MNSHDKTVIHETIHDILKLLLIMVLIFDAFFILDTTVLNKIEDKKVETITTQVETKKMLNEIIVILKERENKNAKF